MTAHDYKKQMVADRRWLHAHPEEGWCEFETTYFIVKRLEELVRQKAEPRNRSEQEISGYREVLATIHESYEYINPRPDIILQLHRDLYSYSGGNAGGNYKNSDNVIAETDAEETETAEKIGHTVLQPS